MTTVIKAWITEPPDWPNTSLSTLLVACNGGAHFHVYYAKERRYENLADADAALGQAMHEASAVYGVLGTLVWDDDTDTYEGEEHIVRGDN
jgi:hypothetical protein